MAVALSDRIGEATFERWFIHVSLDRIDSEAVVLTAPSSIYQVWIEENFRGELDAALGQFLKNFPPVTFELGAAVPPDRLGGNPLEGRDHGDDDFEIGESDLEKTTNLRHNDEGLPLAGADSEAESNWAGRSRRTEGQDEVPLVDAGGSGGRNGNSGGHEMAACSGGDDGDGDSGKHGSQHSNGGSTADA